MKKICAITMARNDEFFLNRWIEYYGNQLGEENLFIFLDGEDQPIPKHAGKANVKHCERVVEHVVAAEKRRLDFLSQTAAELLKDYDLVIGVDADEFLVVDPRCENSLEEYLSAISCKTSISGLGLDVGQNTEKEEKLDINAPFLLQRDYALVCSRYTKPSVISKPLSWGSGFHRIKGHNFNIDPNLYLLHFGSVDLEMIRQKFFDKDLISTGRQKHIKKRARTIDIVTRQKNVRAGDKWFALARTVQTIIRPVYALNKPSMAGWKLVVKIPERFKTIC